MGKSQINVKFQMFFFFSLFYKWIEILTLNLKFHISSPNLKSFLAHILKSQITNFINLRYFGH